MVNQGISFIASIITIITFWGSLKYNIRSESTVFPDLMHIDTPIRFLSFVLIEIILAHVFGKIIVYIEKLGGGVPFMMVFFISLTSAWTSLFNVQLTLLGPIALASNHDGYVIKFIISTLFAMLIGIYFVEHHGSLKYRIYDEIRGIPYDSNVTRCVGFHILSFLIMGIIMVSSIY